MSRLLDWASKRFTNTRGVYVTGGIASEDGQLRDEYRINYYKRHIGETLRGTSWMTYMLVSTIHLCEGKSSGGWGDIMDNSGYWLIS